MRVTFRLLRASAFHPLRPLLAAGTLLALAAALVLVVAPGLLLTYAGPRTWDLAQRLALAPGLSLGALWAVVTVATRTHLADQAQRRMDFNEADVQSAQAFHAELLDHRGGSRSIELRCSTITRPRTDRFWRKASRKRERCLRSLPLERPMPITGRT